MATLVPEITKKAANLNLSRLARLESTQRIVKKFPMMCCHSGEIGIYSTTPKFQKLLSMANIQMYIIDPQ